MGYSDEHVAATRRKILLSAGRLIRRQGFQGVGIDEIMAGAGLTRGGFYAHFRSKEDLFRRVLEEDFDFTLQLRRARASDPDDGRAAALQAVEYYLRPGNRARIARGCTMVANLPDIARASKAARRTFETAFEDLATEFEALLSDECRGERGRALSAISQCVGAVAVARTFQDEPLAEELLEACRNSVMRELGYPPQR